MPPRRADRAAWQRAGDVLAGARATLLAAPGVVAVDLGVRLRGGRPTGEPALRVHVRVKGDRVPGTSRLPPSVEGVALDVVEAVYRATDDACPSTWSRSVRDPLVGGVAIGRATHRNVGTLGAIVVDGWGEPLGLTADHVVRRGGLAEPVVQPPHGTAPVADVLRAAFDAEVDAALLRLRPRRAAAAGLRDGPIRGVLDPVPRTHLPLPVVVVGGCSGPTAGWVTGTDFAGTVDYREGPVAIVGHLHVLGRRLGPRRDHGGPVTRPGDSGALVLEAASRKVVGLVRAGEAAGQPDACVATPIATVLARLRVSFL